MRSFKSLFSYVLLPATVLAAQVVTADFVRAQDVGGQQTSAGQLVTEQWIQTDSEGTLGAVIVAPRTVVGTPQELPVIKLGALDGTVYEAEFDPQAGGLAFQNVPTGVYTLVARAPGMIACYAVHVVAGSGADGEAGMEMLQVVPAALSADAVRDAIVRYVPPVVDVDPQMNPNDARELLQSQSFGRMHRVLQSAGGLRGKIAQAGTGMSGSPMTNVMIYAAGEVIAQTTTAEDGSFVIETLPSGTYAVVAIGPSGIGITSVEVIDELLPAGDTANAAASDRSGRLVAQAGPAFQTQFELQLAPAGSESPLIQELVSPASDQPAGLPNAAPLSGGPMNGGGFGGSGGGIGGGGGLLGLAAAGIGVAALAADDDDNLDIPPVVSPVNPASSLPPAVVNQSFVPDTVAN